MDTRHQQERKAVQSFYGRLEGGREILMSRFNVGDTVQIRSKDWIERQEKNGSGIGPAPCFTKDMEEYAGRTGVIRDITDRGYYHLKDIGFIWTDWMFEGAPDLGSIYLCTEGVGWELFNISDKEALEKRGIVIGYEAQIGYEARPTIIYIIGSSFPVSYWGEDRIDIGCQRHSIEAGKWYAGKRPGRKFLLKYFS
jgi:hypothetical protein